jgi:twitching motility protein PilT
MGFEIDECLRYVVEREGSDLHLKVDSPPMARIHGSLAPIEGQEALRAEDTQGAVERLMASEPEKREEFEADGEADLSYEVKGVSRFRVNAFRQRGTVSIVCRAIPFQVRTIEDLGLPPVIRKLADEPRGIILLTGTTGSGKSTTLAAMIDHINSSYPHHIITLEDPIEYLHRDKRSIINQREVGADTHSFARAMKRVLRQDPDVILIGEMRDEETVRTALSAAETGHLVLSTLHTLDATETINRIIDFFPPHLQQQARVMLAATLKGAVSQRLVPTADGAGRVAASEILVVTGRVQDLILNPNETGKIGQVIAEGEYYGMQTFDQSLLAHVGAGTVSEKVAMEYASSPHDFKLMLAAGGKRASDIDQMDGSGDEVEQAGEPEEPLTTDDPATPTPTRPAPAEAAPSAAANGGPQATGEPEYGAAEHAFGGRSADGEGDGADPEAGLGSDEYAEIWKSPEPGG